MRFFSWLSRFGAGETATRPTPTFRQARLNIEILEEREVPATFSLSSGVLTVIGTPQDDRIALSLDASRTQIVVQDDGRVIGRFASNAVNSIKVFTGEGNDRIQVAPDVAQPALLDGGNGKNTLIAGGGPTTLVGGNGNSKLGGGTGATTFVGGSGNELLVGGTSTNTGSAGGGLNKIIGVTASSTIAIMANDNVKLNNPNPATLPPPPDQIITAAEAQQLMERAAAATSSTDAIITVVDRNGRVLGVYVENGVAPEITKNAQTLTFAIDGALAEARSAAYFSSNQSPLTTRTVSFLSQTTVTQREVESNPNDTDPNSTIRGPGLVAPVRIGANFPPGVPNTPEVDLFGIEHSNRDSLLHPGADGIKGTGDDIVLPARFNIDPKFVPAGQTIYAPESYGFVSGKFIQAQARGIGTLPGGIPLFKNGQLVGAIGVFFPGKTGYATEMNSALSKTYNPNKLDRSEEAEYMGFAAAGGTSGGNASIGAIGGIPPLPGYDLPFGRIDLVGITLDIYGPGGSQGVKSLVAFGKSLGEGSATSGTFQEVDPGPDKTPGTADDRFFLNGLPAPSGWLVTPHDGAGITAAEVIRIVNQGIAGANTVRSAIRVPLENASARMVFSVVDRNGQIVGLYRMQDSLVDALDVTTAKARNSNYYNDPSKLQPVDQLPGIAPGTAFTTRTFRFLALPRYPSGAQGTPPAIWSQLNDGGADPTTGLQVGPRLPASAYQSEFGFASFNPSANFHDPTNIANQNGMIFFPGSSALYRGSTLIGGLGVSGDGVDQNDVVQTIAQLGFDAPDTILRADQVFFRGVRLPYQKYNRNPQGGIIG